MVKAHTRISYHSLENHWQEEVLSVTNGGLGASAKWVLKLPNDASSPTLLLKAVTVTKDIKWMRNSWILLMIIYAKFMVHFWGCKDSTTQKMMTLLGTSMKLYLHQQKQREGNQMAGPRIISNGGLRVEIMDIAMLHPPWSLPSLDQVLVIARPMLLPLPFILIFYFTISLLIPWLWAHSLVQNPQYGLQTPGSSPNVVNRFYQSEFQSPKTPTNDIFTWVFIV